MAITNHNWKELGFFKSFGIIVKEVPETEWPSVIAELPQTPIWKGCDITFQQKVLQDLQLELQTRRYLDPALENIDLASELGKKLIDDQFE